MRLIPPQLSATRTSATLPGKVAALIGGAVALVFGALSFVPAWRDLELKGFDLLAVRTAPMRSTLPITIVAIDEASFGAMGMQMPWPRSVYAKLLEKLNDAGAMLVVFDVIMDTPSNAGKQDDAAFAKAIGASNVVLAADRIYQESAHGRQLTRVEPLEEFRRAGATSAFAGVTFDSDFEVRKVPQGDDVFWRVMVRKVNELHPGMLEITEPDRDAMIRYAGPDHTFPYIPFYKALDSLPAEALRDNIVIVGRDLRATTDQGAAQGDLFYTPFTAATGWLTPGAEIHANILESVVRGDSITPAPDSSRLLLMIAAVAAAAWAMRRWRPVVSALVAAGIIALIAVIDWALFSRLHVWLPVYATMSSVAAAYLVFGAVVFIAEQYRKAEIRRAFSLYVSSEVVDHVLAHPERLKLGGERREVTLLFTDLKGFTTLSERLGAEEVAKILNMHFTGATGIVKRNGGTVNRFMGDAVMAMWGAPVDDPQQALHAVRAACEMQKDIAELRERLRAQGLPEIAMRIGVHSCVAVVGNLGAADRFEYTAIGDGVNLASRLEGVNKLYDTGILVSGDTVAKVGDTVPMRLVDRVIVKGKSEAVDIYTPCEDGALVEMTAGAVAAYRERRWEASELMWQEILRRHPDDGVCAVYIERIARCRIVAPAPTWQGAVELEKL
jgi:adenylate cyclase